MPSDEHCTFDVLLRWPAARWGEGQAKLEQALSLYVSMTVTTASTQRRTMYLPFFQVCGQIHTIVFKFGHWDEFWSLAA
jgi:hypothetical protein